jgi:DNA mismatch repair protein MutS
VNLPLRFESVLFDRPEDRVDGDESREPAFFRDLNLDQVVEAMTAGRKEYELVPFFHMPLRDVEAVRYRQDILRDLQTPAVFEGVKEFARKMCAMREHLAQAEQLRYQYQKERWFVDAAEIYCDAVGSLAEELPRLEPKSRGLLAFGEYLAGYAKSDGFTTLAREREELKEALAAVRYCVEIRGNRVRVFRYLGETDYSAEVGETFAKFKQGAVKDYRVKFPAWAEMDHVEARILDLVARLYPDVFMALDEYCAGHSDFLDRTISAFDREVQFYLAYLGYIGPLKASGLPFCYPHVSARSKEIQASDAFDLALASKLVPEGSAVVCNDFDLDDPERIFVVTGPNQGGKTTFARMLGQLHYLASLGFPVPGRRARLFLPDEIFTHFEKEEDIATLRGKLEDELVRIHDILRQATGNSIVIMNESFGSTTLSDAVFLGTEVMKQIVELGAPGVCVTFVDELASLSETTVSMVATVVPDNPAVRTYKIVRKPAVGLAYAAAIAEKYGLAYESLRRRVVR